jgi:hypothetical protein
MTLKQQQSKSLAFSIAALMAAIAVAVLLLTGYFFFGSRKETHSVVAGEGARPEADDPAPPGSSMSAPPPLTRKAISTAPFVRPPPPESIPRPTGEYQVDARSRELVNSLIWIDGRAMTPEQVSAWRQNLQNLVQQGSRSVPAIAEFLEKNQDIDFGTGKSTLGHSSARRALFDALAQIGGAESSEVLVRTLKESADPREIAALAGHLAQVSLEEHRGEILQAARDVLGMAGNSGLGPDADVGPLFEVLQKYGDQSVIADLEKDGQRWKYYSAIALANLPEGAGIPSLVRMANEDGGNKISALQMLGAYAHQYPEAKSALLEQVRQNKIAPNAWPYLIDGLAGREFGFVNSESDTARAALTGSDLKSTSIKFGNQNYYSAPNPATMTPEFIQEKDAIIDQLKSMTSDPAALRALEQAQSDLKARIVKRPDQAFP